MMSIGEAAQALGARRTGAETQFSSVSTDSRTLAPGALFVALRGEHFDGHEFLVKAKARGATAAMVDEQAASAGAGAGMPLIVVTDTRKALGKLAAHWRGRFKLPLIVIAGSNGKTTVKEMTAAILRAQWGAGRILATEGNLNNDIGLPLTLLRLRAEHAVAAIELGMNHPGETAELAAIAQPTVGLVNNAQREHQEFMKNVGEVAAEHGALFAALPADGTAVINADDEYANYWRSLLRGQVVRDFGVERLAAVHGHYRLCDAGSQIELCLPEGERATFTLKVAGVHNVRNAVAAAAAATAAGAGLAAVAQGLAQFAAVKGRLQRLTGRGGAVILDDTYNANPDSVRAAIDVLARMQGQRVLVLGDMGEVGALGPAFHNEIGAYARSRADRLFTLGALSAESGHAFGPGSCHFDHIDPLNDVLRTLDAPGNTILVKGSRFMKMERVVTALAGDAPHKEVR